MAIESDVANADSRLAVKFYKKAMKNEFKTGQEGRPIFEDMDFVTIFVPGDNLSIIDTPVREEHKVRFALQWAHYLNTAGGDTKEIGTPLNQWPLLTPAQVEELRALKFFTVEAIANAADQALQRIGMVAGMSPFAFRDRAIRFLKVASDESQANAEHERIKALEAENAKLKEETEKQLAEMREQLKELTARGKPGRKPQVELRA